MEPLIHYIIPVVFLIAFAPNLNKKLILLLSPLLFLPDFDFFIKAKVFHCIFFVLGVSFIVYLIYNRFIQKDKKSFYLSLFYLSSHILFDLGGPGVPFFYPISSKLYNLNVLITTSPAKPGKITHTAVKATTQSLTAATKDQLAPIVSTPGVLIFILAVSIIITLIIIKYYNKENIRKILNLFKK